MDGPSPDDTANHSSDYILNHSSNNILHCSHDTPNHISDELPNQSPDESLNHISGNIAIHIPDTISISDDTILAHSPRLPTHGGIALLSKTILARAYSPEDSARHPRHHQHRPLLAHPYPKKSSAPSTQTTQAIYSCSASTGQPRRGTGSSKFIHTPTNRILPLEISSPL